MQDVAAAAARKRVVAVVAGQVVIEGRAAQALDFQISVTDGVTGSDAAVQTCSHSGGGVAIAGNIEASPTINHIATAATAQDVVAVPANELIRSSATQEDVIACVTEQPV